MDRFYDNTRVSAFRVCPRMFFYRHEKHWVPDRLSAALVGGGGWHEMMDVIWVGLSKDKTADTEELAREAFRAFMKYWEGRGFPPLDEMDPDFEEGLGARHPMGFYEMALNYIDARRDFITDPDMELLEVELPFVVPLDPNDPTVFYAGRLDKVVRYRGEVLVIEHKTTSEYRKDGPFRDSFLDSFSPNSQIDGYLFAGKIKYGKEFKGVWIDAALVHKQIKDAFKFIPMDRIESQLEAFLWETLYHVKQIEANKDRLNELDSMAEENVYRPNYLAAFPKNTSSCSMYGGCAYRNLCKMFSNPAKEDEPPGYKIEPWSPFKELGLEKIGVKK